MNGWDWKERVRGILTVGFFDQTAESLAGRAICVIGVFGLSRTGPFSGKGIFGNVHSGYHRCM